MTRCQFDFCAPFRGEHMAVRFILVFAVQWKHGLEAIRVICCNDYARKDQPVEELADPPVRAELGDWIQSLLSRALNRLAEGYTERATVARRYLTDFPGMLTQPVRLLPGVIVHPTAMRDDLSPVGAVTCTLSVPGQDAALTDSADSLDRAVDMITFAVGSIRRWSTKPGAEQKVNETEVFAGGVRSLRRIYPGCDTSPAQRPNSDPEINARRLTALAQILQRPGMDDERVWGCLAAFRDAKETARDHGGLSIVAFVASLAALCRESKCPGKVSCSECGPLDLLHNLSGERAVVEELVLAANPGISDERTTMMKRIIRTAYREMRSGFVHTARTRFEAETNSPFALIRPTAEDDLVKQLEWRNALHLFGSLAQRAIIVELAKRARYRLSESDWQLDKPAPVSQLGESSIRLAGTARGVMQLGP